MSLIVIRHGFSQANNRENIGTPLFGSSDAELEQEGIAQARELKQRLLADHAIETSETPVAVSEYYRSQQTAEEACFIHQQQYAALNEIEPEVIDMTRLEIKAMIQSRKLTKAVLHEAAKTLESLPAENVLITHGLRIAGMCVLLNQHVNGNLVPFFCEIRELKI